MITVRRVGEVTQLKMARTVLGWPLYAVCAYFVDGLLLDTGPPAVQRELRGVLADLPVHVAVNTHAHEDHVGNNALLAERGVTPFAHPLAIPLIAAPPHLQLYRQIVWGVPVPAAARPVPEELATPRYRFRVLHT